MHRIDDDVVVVGAGPAGLHAAVEAARAGASVTLLDEQHAPGGQIYRSLPAGFSVGDPAALGPDYADRTRLLAEFGRWRVRTLYGALAWGWATERTVEVVHDGQCLRVSGTSVVLATGAYDRPTPLPGWTLPGVLTVGGAQTLLKTQRVVPGRRLLLAGTGPLLLVVAAQLAAAGAEIVAVIDPVPARSVLPHLPALLRAWPVTRRGLGYHWVLRRRRVPWITPAVILRIEGDGRVQRAVYARSDAGWRPIPGTEREVEVDTVCLGYGLVPSIELARAAGAAVAYDADQDVWVPVRNDSFETTVKGVFAVGDGAGVAGAVVAAEEGRIAGIAAAQRAGRIPQAEAGLRCRGPRARLDGLRAFRRAMDHVYRVRGGLQAAVTPDPVVCRCEEVSAHEIASAVADGAGSLNQVKAWTRAGMGPCQARMCGLTVARMVASLAARPVADVGCATPRPPVKPVPIEVLAQDRGTADTPALPANDRRTDHRV